MSHQKQRETLPKGTHLSRVNACPMLVHPSPSSGALSTISTTASSNLLVDLADDTSDKSDEARRMQAQSRSDCGCRTVSQSRCITVAATCAALLSVVRWRRCARMLGVLDAAFKAVLRSRLAKVALGIVGACNIFILRTWLKRTWKYRSEGWKKIVLDDFECTVGMVLPVVSATTFYECDRIPVSAIRERVQTILKLNPWLAGRLHIFPQWMQTSSVAPRWLRWLPYQYALMEPPSAENRSIPYRRDESLVELGDIGLHPDMPYDELLQKCGEHVAVSNWGILAMITEAPLFQVTLIPAGAKRFAMVVSLSHAIADGHTFYSIHGMLDATAEVRALDRETSRPQEKDAAKQKTFGLHKFDAYWDSRKLVFQFLQILFRPTAQATTYLVSTDWLKQEKQRAVTETAGKGFVSTNDVLTSAFLNVSECSSGWIAFNFRNRTEELKDEHAGNFEGVVPYWPDEFATPLKIRQSLKMLSFESHDVPGYIENAMGRFSGVTNWSTFYRPVQIDGCRIIKHVPTMDCRMMTTWSTMIIFKVDSDSVGVCIFSRSPDLMTRVAQSPMVRPWRSEWSDDETCN